MLSIFTLMCGQNLYVDKIVLVLKNRNSHLQGCFLQNSEGYELVLYYTGNVKCNYPKRLKHLINVTWVKYDL